MKKLAFIILVFVFCTSCGEEEVLTSGQRMIADIQATIDKYNIDEVVVIPIGSNAFGLGSSSYSFSNESIRVDDQYYNVNLITRYWAVTYDKPVDLRIFEVNLLVIEMDSL